MVSLGDGSSSSGRHYFSNEPLINQDDDVIVDRAISTEEEPQFQNLRTIWSSLLVLFVLIASQVLLFALPIWCGNGSCYLQSYSTLIFLQAAIWCFLLLIDQYLRWQHSKIQKLGYLQFYRKTLVLKRAALYVFSLGNVCLLLLSVIFKEFCFKPQCLHGVNFQPIHYVQLIMTAEVLVSFPLIATYLAKAVKFNIRRAPPDVNQEDFLSSFTQIHVPHTEVGYREENIDTIVEKQADIIRYLKLHQATLGRKLIQLKNELRTYKRKKIEGGMY